MTQFRKLLRVSFIDSLHTIFMTKIEALTCDLTISKLDRKIVAGFSTGKVEISQS
jgi:hypothetical protein